MFPFQNTCLLLLLHFPNSPVTAPSLGSPPRSSHLSHTPSRSPLHSLADLTQSLASKHPLEFTSPGQSCPQPLQPSCPPTGWLGRLKDMNRKSTPYPTHSPSIAILAQLFNPITLESPLPSSALHFASICWRSCELCFQNILRPSPPSPSPRWSKHHHCTTT